MEYQKHDKKYCSCSKCRKLHLKDKRKMKKLLKGGFCENELILLVGVLFVVFATWHCIGRIDANNRALNQYQNQLK